ncbi:MAG: BlaI/MecI/CopY family transcriptional regulator [Flavobacteriales bacterium]|nr:BlaI/MecI/CopY family transcriptional regulator [Flavobacteriales bacterium]
MEQLTKAEEQVMLILWLLEKAFVREILKEYPEPKPAYNTVSTIVRILVNKGVVGFKERGRSHEYSPLISKSEYSKKQLSHLLNGYFSGSIGNLMASWNEEEQINTKELDEILKIIQKGKQQ